MKVWPFAKPKTPGFGISERFYLTVLSSRAVLPAIRSFVDPKPADGAVSGFGAPLSGQKDRSALDAPLERGAYAVASRDRKTVLRMLVLSTSEAGFDPEAYARSSLALGASDETIARLRGTWTLLQLKFESHDPMVYPAVDFLLSVSKRLAELTEGLVADTVCQRYLLPEQVFAFPRMDPLVDVREVVSISKKERSDGLAAFTLGLQKFNQPELEIAGLSKEAISAASRFLLASAQSVLMGNPVASGDKFGAPTALFEAREGGFDLGIWDGTPVLELLPPASVSSSECVQVWAEALQKSAL